MASLSSGYCICPSIAENMGLNRIDCEDYLSFRSLTAIEIKLFRFRSFIEHLKEDTRITERNSRAIMSKNFKENGYSLY